MQGSSKQISLRDILVRRYREFTLIGRDPILTIGLLITFTFIIVFVFYPILLVIIRSFFDRSGGFDVQYYARYFDPYFARVAWQTLSNTIQLGLYTATAGTVLGFIFAYTMVRCNPPFKNLLHILTLVPTVSPPFAIAMATIFLFGRNGFITARILGMKFPLGANDIYGMDGLVFVQSLTFFSVSYLIIRAMLERLNPSIEEAAHSLGASKIHIFRTITLPLLIPGIAASFLLLFVESLADLGNPLLLSGNTNILASQIFLAVVGEFDYQKASTLAFILLLPTLVVFVVQRYYVSQRSYISVTGKPASGHIYVKEPFTRAVFITITYLIILLILVMYLSILVGSISQVWGIDFTPTLIHWQMMMRRGLEAILDTTFLSILATPVAGLIGMVIAYLVVRKDFSGKDTLDFGSNLGAGVPGTILGIGFILTFVTPPTLIVGLLFIVFALFLATTLLKKRREQALALFLGGGIAGGFWLAEPALGFPLLMYIIGGGYIALGLYAYLVNRRKRVGWVLGGMGFYLMMFDLSWYLARPFPRWGFQVENRFLGDVLSQLGDYIQVFFQAPPAITMCIYACIGVLLLRGFKGRTKLVFTILLLGLGGGLGLIGKPLALVGTAYIIIAAFVVRSLPASVRAGIAALQQIDPALDEASNSLGADAQYTFRKVTLPLISPALLAGLIFSFTRHMTSLSAIIFLVSPRWRIVTASILAEWEQGGQSFAAAYASVIIILVLIAIGFLYFITNKVLGRGGEIDLSLGA